MNCNTRKAALGHSFGTNDVARPSQAFFTAALLNEEIVGEDDLPSSTLATEQAISVSLEESLTDGKATFACVLLFGRWSIVCLAQCSKSKTVQRGRRSRLKPLSFTK